MNAARPTGVGPLAWHSIEAGRALSAVGADATRGLASSEAAARLASNGCNDVPLEATPPWWRVLLRQFTSPLIVALLAAAALSVGMGDVADAAFIGIVLAINATIGGVQEWRAERSTDALRRLLRCTAVVVRDGVPLEVDARHVVAGDVLLLESGARVPADARLLVEQGLRVDESLLTGESLPVEKEAAWIGPADTLLADRLNMLHAGTMVQQGRARAVVVATGADSEVGRLAGEVRSGPAGRSPLAVRLERFSRVLGAWVVGASAIVAIAGVLIHGRGWAEMALFGISLAVAAIPEGLPVAITVALAVAGRRMAHRGVIVRRLGAVEGLGSCSLIATDKTGTLTCNELTVREVRLSDGRTFLVSGEGFAPSGSVRLVDGHATDDGALVELALTAALCNEGDLHQRDGGWVWRGDPTDVALLSMARKVGVVREEAVARNPEHRRIPFEPERRFAASFHLDATGVRVFVKGAPERVIDMCELDDRARETAHRHADLMAQRGFRVLALAGGPVAATACETAVPAGLVFRGLVGMIDPLRPGVAAAIERCRDAGIDVSMITGDHPVTALAIAKELGLATRPSEVVSGATLPAGEAALREAVGRVRVFARVAPDQKLAIVRAAVASGRFVAVTGDGVNDAPALRAANIGVAMGRGGTDMARDAADLVISDDDFSTIVAGVEEGRIAYANIRKVVFLLVSTGAAEVLLATLAVAGGWPLPLMPVQLLWLNLVTNGIQDVALAFEPGEGDELQRPPRPAAERLLDRAMVERVAVSASVMTLVALGAWSWMVRAGWPEAQARNGLLLLMVLFENILLANCRSERRSAFAVAPWRSPVLFAGTLSALAVHVAAMHLPPLQRVLGVAPVSGSTWAAMIALATTVLLADEAWKFLQARRRRR